MTLHDDHLAWTARDIAALWDHAEQHADTILREADWFRHVSQALALVEPEPPYVPEFGPASIPVAPPIPDWERALLDEPDDQPDDTLTAWSDFGRMLWRRYVVKGLVLIGMCGLMALAVSR